MRRLGKRAILTFKIRWVRPGGLCRMPAASPPVKGRPATLFLWFFLYM